VSPVSGTLLLKRLYISCSYLHTTLYFETRNFDERFVSLRLNNSTRLHQMNLCCDSKMTVHHRFGDDEKWCVVTASISYHEHCIFEA
jgi:hypothetical protein